MSQAGTILEAYKEAVVAQKEKRYLKAARLFRIANMAFENADVPDWGKDIGEMGIDAGYLYWKMYRKLSKKEKELLKFERNTRTEQVMNSCPNFVWGWREMIRHDYELILKEEILYKNSKNNTFDE